MFCCSARSACFIAMFIDHFMASLYFFTKIAEIVFDIDKVMGLFNAAENAGCIMFVNKQIKYINKSTDS